MNVLKYLEYEIKNILLLQTGYVKLSSSVFDMIIGMHLNLLFDNLWFALFFSARKNHRKSLTCSSIVLLWYLSPEKKNNIYWFILRNSQAWGYHVPATVEIGWFARILSKYEVNIYGISLFTSSNIVSARIRLFSDSVYIYPYLIQTNFAQNFDYLIDSFLFYSLY